MVLMSKIAVQAYRTFCQAGAASEQSFHQNLSKLRDLVYNLTARDLNLDDALVRDHTPYYPESGLAPVTFIDIWKDKNFSMSIFVLKPGTRLPMHDHPGMHGLIRVIYGRMNVFSYSLPENSSGEFEPVQKLADGGNSVRKGDVFPARMMSASSGDVVDINSETVVLTPTDGNIHEIRTADSPAAFFDILAPPYDDKRSGVHQCHYYKELPTAEADTVAAGSSCESKLCNLVRIPAPFDYWTDYADYHGPDFDPYDASITT